MNEIWVFTLIYITTSSTRGERMNLLALSGALLCLLGLPLLALNERAAVRAFIKHGEGLGQVLELSRDDTEINTPPKAYVGRLIHLSCAPMISPTTAAAAGQEQEEEEEEESVLSDPDTGVAPPRGAFMLRRNVEMLQWVESRVAGDEYEYNLEWRAERVQSKLFHDRSKVNPAFPIASSVFVPPGGVVLAPHGAGSALSLSLGERFLRDFLATSRGLVHFPVAALPEQGFDNAVKGDARGGNILGGKDGGGRLAAPRKKLSRDDLSLGTDGVLHTGDATEPGDLRITYDVADAGTQLSVIGGVVDEKGAIWPFVLPSTKKILMIELGTHSAASMVRRSDYENGLRLFSIRVAAFGMLFVGQLLVYSSGVVDAVLPVGAGVCTLALAGSAIATCVLVGALWVAASWTVGVPMLVTGPACYFVFRQYSAAKVARTRMYTRVPVRADDADDVDFPEEEEF